MVRFDITGSTSTCLSDVAIGRLIHKRKMSSKLWFMDLQAQGNRNIQVVLNHGELLKDSTDEGSAERLASARSTVRVGDWIGVQGYIHRTSTGELSLLASQIPQLLSPSLQPIPEKIEDPEFRSRHRHVERIVESSARDVLVLRHKLIAALRTFLSDRDFVEVTTPLLGAEAGGAVARPFNTHATEFKDTKLSLRVAPELYLKRLIVGNMQRVFEIGPAFRNEGVDHTHNPEFTICEFYQAMATLPKLMRMTEELFEALVETVNTSRRKLPSVPKPDDGLDFSWGTLDFIPALESAIQASIPSWHLPDLTHPSALSALLHTYTQLSLSPPSDPNLPRLLDDLAAHFLESQSTSRPLWITHHPACMSPLAKSFPRAAPSGLTHEVSARAELFIAGREYVNCYEEENSPVEQRRKFEAQIAQRAGGETRETHGVVDESYVRALEYGMPPTGGWGCGVDRLVMLFSGRERIGDVLPFGTLSNVVALNSDTRRKMEASGKESE